MQTRLRQVAFDLVQTSFESYLNISQTNCESEISDCRWNVYTFEIWQTNSSLAGPGWIELSSRCAGSRVSRPTAQWKGATFFSKRSTVLHVHFSMFPPFHYVVTTSLQEPTKAKVFSSCRPDFFSSLFLRFLERPNGLIERLQFHDFHVVFFTVLCSLQSCCESVSILSKSFECHMLGVWRTRHRCQSSHFPRDCVVTYLFKIQSPSLHLSLFLKWMRMHCFKQLLADRR